MIELYHGSNIEIDKIDLKKGRIGKDFGRGFYLSEDKTQALKMAETAVDREETGTPTITTFLFDESLLQTPNILNVKIFKEYSKEWAQFVFMNRSNKTETQAHDFDVVYGPIANDKVGVQIRRFMMKYIDIEQLVKELEFIHPTFQYFFGTEKAISCLTKKRMFMNDPTQSAIDKQFLIECLAKDLIEILMEERGYSMEKAMDVLYKSHTFEKIENEKTGLYYQSSVYVMSFLNDELNN